MLKIMKVNKRELQAGDLVLQDNGHGAYIILYIGVTWLHSHHYIHVRYLDMSERNWTIEELTETKTICRFVGGK